MTFKCEIIEREAQNTLSVRTTSSAQNLPEVLGKHYKAIGDYLHQLNEEMSEAPFVAYYNLDMDNLDIEIGIPVSKKIPNKDEIKSNEISAGKYGSCLYTGPYNEMRPAYDALHKFIIEKEYEPTGIAYEMYLNDPAKVPPEQLQTQILFPLK